MARIYYEVAGAQGLKLPAYAMSRTDENDSASVAGAIARKNGCYVVTMRADHMRDDGAVCHSVTIGKPCPGGGWTPVKQLWIWVQS